MDPLTYHDIAVNDVRLQVSITNEGGERGLALLLHGFPELAFSWRYQIPVLADAGYEVWVPAEHAVRLNGRVLVTELSGSESVAHFDIDGRTWVAQSHGVHPYEVGAAHDFFIDVEGCLYFDADGRLVMTG